MSLVFYTLFFLCMYVWLGQTSILQGLAGFLSLGVALALYSPPGLVACLQVNPVDSSRGASPSSTETKKGKMFLKMPC